LKWVGAAIVIASVPRLTPLTVKLCEAVLFAPAVVFANEVDKDVVLTVTPATLADETVLDGIVTVTVAALVPVKVTVPES
jgi:hypothetical protein